MGTKSAAALGLAWSGLALLCPACGTSGAATDVAGSDEHDVVDTVEATSALPDISLDERRDEPTCVPDCYGKICGDDGCGGTCGMCDPGAECWNDGTDCAFVDYPDCEGKVCGDGGFFGTCGTCEFGECSADQTECVCVPDCDGKVCGDDGCGGTCAPGCGDDEICKAGACTCACFGKASRVNALYVPATADETGADAAAAIFPSLAGSACLDLDGDGAPDNGLGALLATLSGFGVDVNAELEKALVQSTLHVLLDLGDDPEAAPFTLNGYLGRPGASAGEFLVDPASFVDGMPSLNVEGVTIAGDYLAAAPASVRLGPLLATTLGLAGMPYFDVPLDRARPQALIDGQIDVPGVALRDGVLAGVLFRADLDRALYLTRVWCAEDPQAPADLCGYFHVASEAMSEPDYVTWDLDLPGCGKMRQLYDSSDPLIIVGEQEDCQALSACLFWAGEKAKITGLAPATAE